ncbi:MAG: folate-binding protein [Devosia sp.]|nr:folate-binding protein [Devosia sp.]
MTIRLRPDRALFRFSGPDAQKLLNDVLTTRVEAMPGPARWWALLSPQGKIQAEGLIGWTGGAFWLDAHESVADAFFKRMRMYRLRADVTMDDLRGTHRVGWFGGTLHDGPLEQRDGRDERLGTRLITTVDEAKAWGEPDNGQAVARITAGVAELGPDFGPDQVFPHDIGMDFLGGVDFKKGCYVGQEVVSRMQHRGTARRRPVIVDGVPRGAGSGAPVLVGEREAGTIGEPANGQAVAILRLDRIDPASPPTVGGLPVTLSLPRWAAYKFGELPAEA